MDEHQLQVLIRYQKCNTIFIIIVNSCYKLMLPVAGINIFTHKNPYENWEGKEL